MLLEAGADLKAKNKHGAYAVNLARDDVKTMTLLATQAALFDASDADGVRVALEKGASVHACIDRWTTLMVVIARGGDHTAEMIHLLINAGADVNKQDKNGRTALIYAARRGGENAAGMMRLLIDA